MMKLNDLILTIDTREQLETRIKSIEQWFILNAPTQEEKEKYSYDELLKRYVIHHKLERCDYSLEGTFNGQDISLGIEAKSLSQFCSEDKKEIKRKLAESYNYYTEVAFFIEAGNYEYTDLNGKKIIQIRAGERYINGCSLAEYEGTLETLQASGIHVRQLRSEFQFPDSIMNLLTYITHEHEFIMSTKTYPEAYKKVLMDLQGIGIQGAKKLIESYPNLFWLCNASEDSYQKVLGIKTGKNLYEFIRNPELITQEWSNKHFPDGTEIESREYNSQDVIRAVTEYLSGFPNGKTADELCTHFHLAPGDEDKEKFLECLKRMAYKNIITSTVTGLFQIPITKSKSLSTEHKGSNPASGGIDKALPDNCTRVNPGQVIGAIPSESKQLGTHGTDGAGLMTVSRPPQQELTAKGNAPVPSVIVQGKDSKKSSSVPIEHKPSPATHDKELDVFGKTNPDWVIPQRVGKMNLRGQLEAYLEIPHLLQDCVDQFQDFTKGAVWEHVMRMKKEGIITEFDNKTFVMKVIK